jgi:outer membrane PBP1 activator LpoA protein
MTMNLQFRQAERTAGMQWVLILLVILLSGCASTPDSDNAGSSSSLSSSQLDSGEAALQALLSQGLAAPSPEKERILYQAASMLISMERDNDALELLDSLDTRPAPLELALNIMMLRAQLYLEYEQTELALQILTNPRFDQLPQLPDNRQMPVRLLRAELYQKTGDMLASASERIHADQIIPVSMIPLNHENIWNALTALDADTLTSLASNERRFEFQGWYELAVIGKAYQYNLDRQLVELERWQSTWTRHPASVYMPQALQLVETMAAERPQTIALLLPVQSQPGIVIRDGFMSAYYDVMQIGGKVPLIRVYDTSESDSILSLYNQAVAEGAEMVIGPLLKENVEMLHRERGLPVPTLALNNIEGSRPLSDNLFQFGLSPENEAIQIAERAWQDGHRYAAILSPAITLDDFFERKKQRFKAHWLALGGHIVAEEAFRDNYTGVVSSLLDINDSETRMEAVSDLIGEELVFTQRRRQDIDMIFLIAEPGPARQINPTLAYLFAGDIPVYGSQDIYSGLPRPLVDNDLNGIVFGDSPWLLSFEDELKAKATQLFPQNNALTLRLQAFGIDAFRLYPRLKQLQTVTDSQIYGATGLLRLTDNNNIIRELTWARVTDGLAQLDNAPP